MLSKFCVLRYAACWLPMYMRCMYWAAMYLLLCLMFPFCTGTCGHGGVAFVRALTPRNALKLLHVVFPTCVLDRPDQLPTCETPCFVCASAEVSSQASWHLDHHRYCHRRGDGGLTGTCAIICLVHVQHCVHILHMLLYVVQSYSFPLLPTWTSQMVQHIIVAPL